MKMAYEPWRSIVFFSGAFNFVGVLPRSLGIVATKPEYQNLITLIDTVMLSVFAASLVIYIWAIVHNARERTHHD